jgi:hypothetical protein
MSLTTEVRAIGGDARHPQRVVAPAITLPG